MNTKRFVLFVSACVLAFFCASAQTWEQIAPPLSINYPQIACSADGTTLLLSGFRISIPIYLSTNSGATWTTTSAPVGTWDSFAISADRTKLVAANYDPRGIYTSADGGRTWISNSVPTAGWTSVAGSADGRRLVAVNNFPGTICISTNSGALWTQSKNAPLAFWGSVASSADGSNLVAVNSNRGGIYTSIDGGTDWVQCTNAPATSWVAVASSVDGSRLVALTSGEQLYGSVDFGHTWILSSLPSVSWKACAVSVDASSLIVCSRSGFIYTSTDYGATWNSNAVPVLSWNSVAISADGSKLFAAADGGNGGVWRCIGTPAPRLEAAVSAGEFRLGWVLPSMDFVLQKRADFMQASWEDVTNVPTLNLSNLQYEIALPLSGQAFYRLKSH
ncbi:MAG: hypothetical protein ACTHLW_21500 [Verrucomicrobiota bacterium]